MSFEYLGKKGAVCNITLLVKHRTMVLAAAVLFAFLTVDSPPPPGLKHLTILLFRKTWGNSPSCAK